MSVTSIIIVSLPVADVAASTAFYTALGATQKQQFSDETASWLVLSDAIQLMVMNHEKFASFLPDGRPIADAKAAVGGWFVISRDSRAAVDTLVEIAGRSGGTIDITPPDDLGFMYGRNFVDPDGHIWNAAWMDPDFTPPG